MTRAEGPQPLLALTGLPTGGVDRFTRPLARFLRIEAIAAALLLLVTLGAVAVANSSWGPSFSRLWEIPFSVQVGAYGLTRTLRSVINEGLMTLFFFLLALELKRELGALKTTQGKFEQAQGGTLLLDEISEMELGLQAKLLRVIQEREVERLGGREIIALDVRILATTNRNLREAVANGKFREDLFYRLNVFPLHLPALRERIEDIGPLAERLLARHAAAEEMARTFSHDALKKLAMHPWRGNVRELDNVIQRALILAQGAEILPCDIRFEEETAVNDPVADDDQSMLQSDLRSREYEMIIKALVSANGSRKQAADTLGISARTLRYKLSRMREQGITVPGVNGEAREMAVPTVESL